MLNPDGPFCLTRPGKYTVLVSVERGRALRAASLGF